MDFFRDLQDRPRRMGALAATLATGLGMAVMAAGSAPPAYLAINGAALIIGMAMLAILLRSRKDAAAGTGAFVLAAAAGLLATALFGLTIDGAARWVRVGVISLQPSLILLPLMVTAFARSRDWLGMLGMVVAALALALQPDRAMAGTLALGLAALAFTTRERRVLMALAAAMAGFAATLAQPDALPATPFVEQVFAGAFGLSPLAGLALMTGGALLLLPGLGRGAAEMPVFSALWLAILLAAVLGNYPTPLLGYGGSGIIGYLLCLTALPLRVGQGRDVGESGKHTAQVNDDHHAFALPGTG